MTSLIIFLMGMTCSLLVVLGFIWAALDRIGSVLFQIWLIAKYRAEHGGQ